MHLVRGLSAAQSPPDVVLLWAALCSHRPFRRSPLAMLMGETIWKHQSDPCPAVRAAGVSAAFCFSENGELWTSRAAQILGDSDAGVVGAFVRCLSGLLEEHGVAAHPTLYDLLVRKLADELGIAPTPPLHASISDFLQSGTLPPLLLPLLQKDEELYDGVVHLLYQLFSIIH